MKSWSEHPWDSSGWCCDRDPLPAFSHLLERQAAQWQPRDQHRSLFGVLKRSVTAAPNVTALQGDSVSLETLNPYSPSLGPGKSPLLRGCWTTTLCRGKDGKISTGCAPVALCEMRGLYAATSHVGKVGGWKKRRECSHCTAALTCFDKKDSVTGLSVFFKMYQPALLVEIVVQWEQKKMLFFSWFHWMITERQKVSQEKGIIYYKNVRKTHWDVVFVWLQLRSMISRT